MQMSTLLIGTMLLLQFQASSYVTFPNAFRVQAALEGEA